MKKSGCFILVLLVVAPVILADSLYDQSIAQVLERGFPGREISYLLLDARTGKVLSSRWEEPGRPVPLGSLVKPFTALAYGEVHGFKYPEYVCRGKAGGCWLPRGHGRVGMTQAMGHSCNAYFRVLVGKVRSEDVSAVMRRFGIQGVRGDVPARALVGLGDEWMVPPVEMARAYCELATRLAEPGVLELVRGMALSAESGTGRAVGGALSNPAALVKTGTAPCVHGRKRAGDGYVMALYPAESPQYALLVRVDGAPGAGAAVVGGRMLHALLEGK